MRLAFSVAAIFIFTVFSSIPMVAHHGASNYDTTLVTIEGTVADFQFVNPHVQIVIDAKDSNGKMEKWVCEATSPNLLFRRGWTKTTLKPGERIAASGYRAKNGATLLRLMKIVANGKEYSDL
jgi:hypothetical protein